MNLLSFSGCAAFSYAQIFTLLDAIFTDSASKPYISSFMMQRLASPFFLLPTRRAAPAPKLPIESRDHELVSMHSHRNLPSLRYQIALPHSTFVGLPGTEVPFTHEVRKFSLINEQFWGRAARASIARKSLGAR